MTIEELAGISHISVRAIKKRAKSIPGAKEDKDGIISFPSGSRYPYNLRGYKLDSVEKRRAALLDATYHYRFINHEILKMPEESFNAMTKELLRAGLLRSNGTRNKFGANKYDTTILYDEIKDEEIRKRLRLIAEFVGASLGSFAGAMMK